MKQKKVITYGSFDLFHHGHYNLLKRAKDRGDFLIVGVTTEQYDEYRGKLNISDSLMQRIENVQKTGFADLIIIEDHEGQKVEDIQKYGVDLFVVGSDWTGRFEYLRTFCEVEYLERTKDVSSTMLRNKAFAILRLGVIGTGRIAKRFAIEAKYVSGVNLEGTYNPNLDSAKKYAESFELNFYTDDLDEFFDRVDAVYIASPHETHYHYIIESLSRHKHVLCEKPLALSEADAKRAYQLAQKQERVLIEAIKTAYAPGFTQMLGVLKGGRIGKIIDVEASFTKLVGENTRELLPKHFGGSVTELASYPLMAIFKILGTEYKNIHFETIMDSNKEVDIYTKIYLRYGDAMATAKIGLEVKSEGQLIISGTNGYLIIPAPWWKTQGFELRFEHAEENESFFSKYKGEGLRYELSDFLSMINGNMKKSIKLTSDESVAIANVIEQFLNRNIHQKGDS